MASRELTLPDKEYMQTFNSEGKSQKLVSQDEFVLEQVLGLTNTSTHALDCNQVTGYVAFPAAFTLVLLDPKTNDQKFIESPSVKYISSVCFSHDGRLVALGESGCKPYVSVWSLKDHKEASKFIIDHSVGVRAIVFHPKSSFLVVLGTHDCNIGVWDYIRGRRLALTKWQTAPLAITIPKNGSNIIVCGHRKITLFNTDNIASNNYETNVFEDRKAVLLGRQSEYTFVDITSGRGKHEKEVYTVTACGFLCEIKLGDILIDKAIKVDVHAFCVRYGLGHVFVGCCEGVVKICHPETLDITAVVSLDQLLGPDAMPKVGAKLYLDTTAIAINDKDDIVTCIYADCSMHSWQINDFSDTVECSALLPASGIKPGSPGYDPSITDNMYKASLFRSFIGCCDKISGSMMFDPATLAARHRQNSRQGFMHLFKENRARYQHANAVRFSPDGRDVVCGNEDGEIKVYDAASGALRRVIEAHSSQVTCIELMYDDEYQLVCSGGRDRIIFVLDAKTDFSLVQVLCDHSAAITTLRMIHNGGLLTLVSAAADNVILVRRAIPGDTLKFTVIGEIAESRCNKSVNITSDYIVTGARNGNIKLFRADPVFSGKPTKTIKCTQKFHQGSRAFRAIDIDPSGSFIAITQSPGQITIYHLQTGQPIASLSSQSDVTAIKFTSDLKYMVSSTSNGCTLVWRLPERMTEFMKFKQEKIYQVEMSREISYETYVSCVRVCKETTVCEDNTGTTNCHSGSNSCTNHTHVCDSEVTPSIESLSLLRMCPTCHGELDRHSMCSTESCLSCSTCSGSYSDTLACDPSTDSSYHMHSAPVRLYCGSDDKVFGKSVESTTCTKLGPFKFESPTDQMQCSFGTTKIKDVKDGASEVKYEETQVKEQIISRVGNVDKGSDLCTGYAEVKPESDVVDNVASGENQCKSSSVDPEPYRPPRDVKCKIGTGFKLSQGDNIGSEVDKPEIRTNIRQEAANALQVTAEKKITSETGELCYKDETRGLIHESEDYKGEGMSLKREERGSPCPEGVPLVSPGKNAPQLQNDQGRPTTVGGALNNQQQKPLDLVSEKTKENHAKTDSPQVERKTFSPTSSPLSYRTACSPKTNTEEACVSPEDCDFHSPGVSPQSDECGSKHSSPRPEHNTGDMDQNLKDLAGNRVRDGKKLLLDKPWISKLSSLLTSKKSPSSVHPNVSVREAGRDDAFFKELQQVCLAELEYRKSKDRTQMKDSVPQTPPNSLENSLETSASDVHKSTIISGNETTKDSEKIQNTSDMASCQTFNEESSARPLIEAAHDVSTGSSDKTETVVNAGSNIFSNLCSCEDGEVYNYHSITRDETGKLRRVKECHDSARNNPKLLSPGKDSVASTGSFVSLSPSDNWKHPHNHETIPWNIQCSRCSHRLGSKSQIINEVNSTRTSNNNLRDDLCEQKNQTDNSSSQPPRGNQPLFKQIPQLASTSDPDSKEKGKDTRSVSQTDSVSSEEQCCAALRQCLQLSNSQETFYKLTWDNDDRELVDTLSVILKTKADQFAKILNLSSGQMDILRKKIYDVDHDTNNTSEKIDSAIMDKSSSTLCHGTGKVATLSLSEERERKQAGTAQWNNSSASRRSSSTNCNESAAKEIINIVERMLAEKKPVDEQTFNLLVNDKAEGMRQLGALLNSAHYSGLGRNNDRLHGGKLVKRIDQEQKLDKLVRSDDSKHRTTTAVDENSVSKLDHYMTMEAYTRKSFTQQYLDSELRQTEGEKEYLEVEIQSEGKDGEQGGSPQGNETSHSSRFQTNSVLYKSRFGKLCSYRAIDTRWVAGADVKHSYTRSASAGREGSVQKADRKPEQTSPASIKRRKMLLQEEEADGEIQSQGQGKETVPSSAAMALMPASDEVSTSNAGNESRSSHESSTSSGRKYTPPIVELFRDQDDYLKKLKEVREKFERSIQALSDERKSRLAEEDIKHYYNK